MTIWHQRLIKFGAKVIGALLLIILIILFFYYNLFFKKDNLLKYVPENALAYATFKADQSTWDNQFLKKWLATWRDSNQIVLEPDDLNSLVGYNLALALIPGSAESSLNFLAIFDLKNQVSQDKYLSILEKNHLYYSLLTPNVLEKRILVVSDSPLIIEQVQRISLQEDKSLADNMKVVINLQQLKGNYSGKVYLNLALLKERLSSNSDLTSQIIINRLTEIEDKALFVGIKLNPDNIQIESTHSRKLPAPADQTSGAFNLLNDSILNLSGQAVDTDLTKLMLSLKSDSDFYKILENNLYNLEKQLKFDIDQDILPLLHKQVAISVNSRQAWVLSLDLAGQADADAKIEKLGNILQAYLALQHPIYKEKQLPDKTYIKQLVIDQTILTPFIKDIPGGQIRFWSLDQAGIGYMKLANNIYVSNNLDKLVAISLNQFNNQKVSQSSCNSQNMAEFTQFLNLDKQMILGYLPQLGALEQVWLGMGGQGNEKIWLCLE